MDNMMVIGLFLCLGVFFTLAYVAERQRPLRWVVYATLAGLNAAALAIGLPYAVMGALSGAQDSVAGSIEELGLGIPDGIEFETVAGFVLHIAGHLPEIGESVRHESLTFMVAEVDGSRISKLVVSKHDGTEEEVQADLSEEESGGSESEDEDSGN